MPLLVLGLSLLATLGASHYQAQQSALLAQQRFEQLGAMVAEEVEATMSAYGQLLRGGAGLFRAVPEVTRPAWASYVETLALARTYPGIQGVGHATVLRSNAEVGDLERQLRAEGHQQFAVRPAGERPLKTAIVLLEPFDWRNQRASVE